ncbi:MAG: hypothetical protein IPI49_26900 [Myxococcales bacterium]|nr:hypothetical protein [Myxococcales bacterium]HRC55222.1 hypothetical protein [Kofleriaceae bacterium]
MSPLWAVSAIVLLAAGAAIGWFWLHRLRALPAQAPLPRVSTPPVTERPKVRVRTTRAGGGAGLAVTTASLACPSCRREYEGALYCSRDARRLVPAYELRNHPRSQGVVCLACRRAFEPGIRRCPHDGTALVPFAVHAAMRPRSRTMEPAGVIARICPVCGARHDLHARFCGADGAELVVIN